MRFVADQGAVHGMRGQNSGRINHKFNHHCKAILIFKQRRFARGKLLRQHRKVTDAGVNGGRLPRRVQVDRDELVGDEDEIDLSFHMSRKGKPEPLPFIPRLTFMMKMEADIWRVNEVSFQAKLPLGGMILRKFPLAPTTVTSSPLLSIIVG